MGLLYRVLLGDVPGYSEQIRFGGANRLVVRDAKESEENLLDKIRYIRSISDPCDEEAPQLLSLGAEELCDEGVPGVCLHGEPLESPVNGVVVRIRSCEKSILRREWLPAAKEYLFVLKDQWIRRQT